MYCGFLAAIPVAVAAGSNSAGKNDLCTHTITAFSSVTMRSI